MKKYFLLSLLAISFFLYSCEETVGVTQLDTGKLLIDTTINVSQQTATISLKEGITVSIPKGLVQTDFKLKIHQIENPPKSPDILRIINAFNITLSCGNTFDIPITVKIDFASSSLNEEKIKENYSAGFYDDEAEKWTLYSKFNIDFENNYIQFDTDHLTTLGFLEFISTGGYPYKFIGVKGFTIYYSLSEANGVMDNSDYERSKQNYHIGPKEEGYAPYYIQDVAHFLKTAKDVFKASPNNLKVPDGNTNVYIKDMKGSSGEFGSISGCIYLNNTVPKLPSDIPNLEYWQMLRSTCSHEFLHLVQDYYYVMNKGSLGMWWLEATATQADRIVYKNNLEYSESEIFSIESNYGLLENLAKPWDDCNKDPDWYLAGCFLQYMSTYRDGTKLNIAQAVKNLGSNTPALSRILLNNEIKNQLNSYLSEEYENYIKYLISGENEKLSALFPNKSNYALPIDNHPTLSKQVKMTIKHTNETIDIKIPYLSTKIINITNFEKDINDSLLIIYNIEQSLGLSVFLCHKDNNNKEIIFEKQLFGNDAGEFVLAGKMDNKYIVVINNSIADEDRIFKINVKVGKKFEKFYYMNFQIADMDYIFEYTNNSAEDSYSIGFVKEDNDDIYSVLSSSFSNNKINIISEVKKEWYGNFKTYKSTLKITSEYNVAEFITLNLKETITKTYEHWSDEKEEWVDYVVNEEKEFQINHIPFEIDGLRDVGYRDYKYTYYLADEEILEKNIKKMKHTYKEYDDENRLLKSYELKPLDWSKPGFTFSCLMLSK